MLLQYQWEREGLTDERKLWEAWNHVTGQSGVLCCRFSCIQSLPGSSVPGILQPKILEWLSSPLPGGLPDPGIEPTSLMSPALAGRFFNTSATWEVLNGLESRTSGLTGMPEDKRCWSCTDIEQAASIRLGTLSHYRAEQGGCLAHNICCIIMKGVLIITQLLTLWGDTATNFQI